MSSATSIERGAPLAADVNQLPEPGSRAGLPRSQRADSGMRAWHFFLSVSLLAATAAILISRYTAPAHLILLTLTITAAGAAAAAVYRTIAPLAADARPLASERLSGRSRALLEREKMLVLRSIKELEFDRAMGKISAADFDEMAGRLRARALTLMKQLDDEGLGYRRAIERELIERSRTQEVAGRCACGTSNDADALFCKRCGTKLAARGSVQ